MQIKARYVILALLIIIPSIVNLSIPIYNRNSPDLYGLPFFYWFQTIWLVICSAFYLIFSQLLERRVN